MSEKISLIYEPQNTYTETGYHATASMHKESIIVNGFKPSNNADDWLGEGVYFWDNIRNAEWWMSCVKKDTGCIFACELKCSLPDYLNLDNESEMNKLNTFSKQYIREMINLGNKKPDFKNNHQRKKFFCDIYCSRKNISILSFTFKHDIINEAGFRTGVFKRRQICVRKPDCISNVRVRE